MEKSTTSSSSSLTGGGDEPKYRGVRKRKWGKWVSEIRLPNSRERIWLGSYDSPEKAARAFDAALFCLRGRNAKFNFPNCPPDIPGAKSLTRQEIQAVAARFANEAPPGEEAAGGDVSAIDWSFLKLLDSNECESSDFGLYSELSYDNMGGELYPPPPQVASMLDHDNVYNGDENDVSNGETYTHHSFLWNF